jgi:phosphatidylserine decarboxylase
MHREGYGIFLGTLLVLAALNAFLFYWIHPHKVFSWIIFIASLVLLYLIIQFFRNPSRNTVLNPTHIIAPADGKVVVIEEVEEKEYFKGKRIQVSIFMSPLNVHVNRNPISGIVEYSKYHPGAYLVAWHPKSSELNERTTLVIKDTAGHEVLFRQIAGAVARRIKYYIRTGQKVEQGKEMGFIKFGSRVDVFLPLGTIINVKLGEKTVGGETVLAEFAN